MIGKDFRPQTRWFLFAISIASLLAFSSCRTARTLSSKEIKPMSADKIIKRVEKEAPRYEYLSCDRVTVNFDAMGSKNSVMAQFKIKKDEKMIMTLKKMGFPIGRGLLAPDSVVAINFIDRNYVSGNYSTIWKLFGFDLNFNLIQALLTADASYYLNQEAFDREFSSSIEDQLYRLDSKYDRRIERALSKNQDKRLIRYMDNMDDNEFFDIQAWVDPEFFVIRKLLLNNIKTEKTIIIEYESFELTGKELLPSSINLSYTEKNREMEAQIKLGKISTRKERDFSFTIPEKYEKFNN